MNAVTLIGRVVCSKERILAEGTATSEYVKDELAKYGQILEDAYRHVAPKTLVKLLDEPT